MVKKLRDVMIKVEQILKEIPITRENDYILYLEYISRFFPDSREKKTADFLVDVACGKNGIPSIETIGRIRRKLAELNPELAGSETIRKHRKMAEEDFKEYARIYC